MSEQIYLTENLQADPKDERDYIFSVEPVEPEVKEETFFQKNKKIYNRCNS